MAYTKVEICGVDTTKLKVLSEKEKQALLKRIREGDRAARNEMVHGNLKLVLSVLQRFSGRGESNDDLFQVGVIGLMKAIDGFDLTLGLKFSTYAVPMIIGEIRRYLRDNNMVRVSRSIRDLAYKAIQAREQLTLSLHREPTSAEIATYLEVPETDVVCALESVCDPVSLDEPLSADGADALCLMDQMSDPVSASDWLDQMAMRETAKKLPKREQDILYLRFFMGHTQTEVAREIGISQAQVSRLEKSAISRIKENWS
ncbi:MAG: SigB/SigF/SigG family RNA polymerase sigma factor [Oscillospiraceae bacterium]|nr:SigB/SigF/SigG family RNA polymerase sigma factor [Oscillospiraceae bacterium]